MGQLVVATAGAVVGFMVGGPTGAQIGWMLGSAAGGLLFKPDPQRIPGARLNDLKIPGVKYGDPIPRFYGRYRTAGQMWWASAKREIVTIHSSEVGGKGGGQEVEQEEITYEIDLLIGLTHHEIAGVPRVWVNGKLTHTSLDPTHAANMVVNAGGGIFATLFARAEAAIRASVNTTAWSRFTVYKGTADQTLDPTYEAAINAEIAAGTRSANDTPIPYRHRAYVFIEGLKLGHAPAQLPQIEFEVVTRADVEQIDALTLLALDFADGTGTDQSTYEHGAYEQVQAQGAPEFEPALGDTPARIVLRNGAPGGPGNPCDQIGWDGDSGGGDSVTMTTVVNDHSGEALTVEFYWKPVSMPFVGGNHIVAQVGRTNDFISFTIHDVASGNYKAGLSRSGQNAVTGDYVYTLDEWQHVALVIPAGGNPTAVGRLYVDGYFVTQLTVQGPDTGGVWFFQLCYQALGNPAGAHAEYAWASLRFEEKYTGTSTGTQNFTPPTTMPGADSEFDTIIPLDETVARVVSDLCENAGLSTSQIDVSDLENITTAVRGIAIPHITTTRSVLEMLMAWYNFEATVSDKIYFRRKARDVVATISYEDLGANNVEPLEIQINNDIEVPAKGALTYANLNSDYAADTQMSDRLLTAIDESIEPFEFTIVATPSEAKAVVDRMMQELAAAAWGTKVSMLADDPRVEPTDAVLAEDEDGTLHRVRFTRMLDNYPRVEFDGHVDDATVVEQAGITSNDYVPEIGVDEPATTLIELLDIPIGRDADDDLGFYIVAKGYPDDSPWPGGNARRSVDNLLYDEIVATITESGVFGTTTTALNDWNGGRTWDLSSTVTVNVGDGTLSSSTVAAVLADKLHNCMLIGNEIIQYVNAELISEGIYRLSKLLRGCRGTNWAMTGHTASERCVLLRTAGIRRVAMETSELGLSRYYIGVTFGRPASSGLIGSPASGEAFANNAVGKKPYSPVHLKIERDASNNITGTFDRRTRLSCRYAGPLGVDVPLGEDSESYEIDVLPVGSPQSVLRTITATTESFSYTAAQQTSDGITPGDQVVFRVYQISAQVGRGYPLQETA